MDFAKDYPIWDQLTRQEQQLLLGSVKLRSVSAGTVLHNAGMDCLGVLLICSGQLRAYILSDEGREITIDRMFPGDICILSASCALPDLQMDIVVETEKDSTVWVIPAMVYKSLMQSSPAVANQFSSLLSSVFSQLIWLVEQVMWKRFDKRLAEFLLSESALNGSDSLKLTHEKIANHLGTSREVVTRTLRYFQSDGMVKLTRGTIEILDRKALAAIPE